MCIRDSLVAVGNFGDIVAEHDVLLDAIARNDTAAIRAQCSRHLYGGVMRLGEELSTKYADYFVSGTHWPDHAKAVSYTHLDVYKRQIWGTA